MSTKKPKIELLDFYADWCGPCQVMKTVIEELKKELKGKVKVTEINVDKQNAKTAKYKVMSIPTYLIVKDGRVISQLQGIQSKEALLKELK
jgi:thioredoxin 1